MSDAEDHIGPEAICLAAIAGFVDAIAFVAIGGFFAASMSANATRFGVELANASELAGLAAAMIFLFVLGVVVGTIVGRYAGGRRQPVLLALIAALLAFGAAAATLSFTSGLIAALVLAMGVANTVSEDESALPVGLLHVTAILARFGDRLTAALSGGDRLAWLGPLLIWVGLVAGATIGAALYWRFGLAALWGASGAAALLAVTATRAHR